MSDCQILAEEEEKRYNAARYGGIGKVKDRTEENEMIAATEGHPCGPIPFNQGKIEHVDNTSVKQSAVAAAEGYELGDHGCRWIVEYESIDDTVDNVARSTSHNEGKTREIAPRDAATYGTEHIYANEDDKDDAEGGEEEFVKELPSEGHSVILGKEQVKPIGEVDALVHIHARLNTYLYDLVNGDDTDSKGCRG